MAQIAMGPALIQMKASKSFTLQSQDVSCTFFYLWLEQCNAYSVSVSAMDILFSPGNQTKLSGWP